MLCIVCPPRNWPSFITRRLSILSRRLHSICIRLLGANKSTLDKYLRNAARIENRRKILELFAKKELTGTICFLSKLRKAMFFFYISATMNMCEWPVWICACINLSKVSQMSSQKKWLFLFLRFLFLFADDKLWPMKIDKKKLLSTWEKLNCHYNRQ